MRRQGAALSGDMAARCLDRNRTAFSRLLGVISLALLSLAADIGGHRVAEAAGVRCRIPAALLCPGCAASIRVTILGNGQCRVTFDTSSPAPGAAKSADLDIEVLTARPPRRFGGSLDRRLRGAKQLRLERLARLRTAPIAPGGRCFEFSGRRYCE